MSVFPLKLGGKNSHLHAIEIASLCHTEYFIPGGNPLSLATLSRANFPSVEPANRYWFLVHYPAKISISEIFAQLHTETNCTFRFFNFRTNSVNPRKANATMVKNLKDSRKLRIILHTETRTHAHHCRLLLLLLLCPSPLFGDSICASVWSGHTLLSFSFFLAWVESPRVCRNIGAGV